MSFLLGLVERLADAVGRSGVRLWRKKHPRLVEGLAIRGGPELPPSYVFRYRPARSASHPVSDWSGYQKWADDFGGAYADKIIMVLAVSSAEPTRIWDVRLVVTARHEAISGWHYQSPPMGGPSTVYTMVASLDSVSQRGRVQGSWHGPSDGPEEDVPKWPWSVSESDPLFVDLVISVDHGCYEWHLEIDYSTAGEPRRTTREPAHKEWIASSSSGCDKLEGSW